jgi:hypothetical protein
VKLAKFRRTKVTCFLSYVEDRYNTNASLTLNLYKYIHNMFPKVGLLEETKGEGKERNNDRK